MSNNQTVVYIDGYWNSDKKPFKSYKCIIGQWDGNEDDCDIFYYFYSLENLRLATNFNPLAEFTVTEYRIEK